MRGDFSLQIAFPAAYLVREEEKLDEIPVAEEQSQYDDPGEAQFPDVEWSTRSIRSLRSANDRWWPNENDDEGDPVAHSGRFESHRIPLGRTVLEGAERVVERTSDNYHGHREQNEGDGGDNSWKKRFLKE